MCLIEPTYLWKESGLHIEVELPGRLVQGAKANVVELDSLLDGSTVLALQGNRKSVLGVCLVQERWHGPLVLGTMRLGCLVMRLVVRVVARVVVGVVSLADLGKNRHSRDFFVILNGFHVLSRELPVMLFLLVVLLLMVVLLAMEGVNPSQPAGLLGGAHLWVQAFFLVQCRLNQFLEVVLVLKGGGPLET